MIQDSVTIIVLGNKYNSNIYHAKDLESIFDSGITPAPEENEEASNNTPVKRVQKKKAHKPVAKKSAAKKHVSRKRK